VKQIEPCDRIVGIMMMLRRGTSMTKWLLCLAAICGAATSGSAQQPEAGPPKPPTLVAPEQPTAIPQSPPTAIPQSPPTFPQSPPATIPQAPLNQTLQLPSETLPSGGYEPSGSDPNGMTIEEIQFIAQTNHPALREASAKVAAEQGRAVQAGMYPNPVFYTASPQWTGGISQYNAFIGQDYITMGKLRLDRAAIERAVVQAQLDFTRTRFAVLTAVRMQFYATAAAQRRFEVLEQLVGVTQRSRDVGKKLLEAGETNRADATLLEIENDKAVLQLQNTQALLTAARKQLAAVAGVPAMPIGRLKFNLSAPLPEYEYEALRLGVVNQNAIAAAAAVEIARTQTLLRRAVVEPYPNFNIQAGFQYAVEAPLHDQGYAQFAMVVPIWNRNQGGIRAAQAETVRAFAGLRRAETELSEQTAQALGEFTAASIRSEIYEKQITPKARDVLRVNQSLFGQGQTDFLRLLQAQRTLIEADLGNVDAQEARWTAASKLAGLLQLDQFP
jgi:cobalt-zinc-cadmium efflux system outer membrane protein